MFQQQKTGFEISFHLIIERLFRSINWPQCLGSTLPNTQCPVFVGHSSRNNTSKLKNCTSNCKYKINLINLNGSQSKMLTITLFELFRLSHLEIKTNWRKWNPNELTIKRGDGNHCARFEEPYTEEQACVSQPDRQSYRNGYVKIGGYMVK